jgi:hypothetical protein
VPRERASDLTLMALREAGAEKTPWQQSKKGHQSTTYLRYVASPK